MKRFVALLLCLCMLLSNLQLSVFAEEENIPATEVQITGPAEEIEPTPFVSTELPVIDPTEAPTAQPTAEATSEPAAEPTVDPTVEPTTEPAAEPTAEPTADITPAHEHSYSSEVKAPTCVLPGYTTLSCECGDSYITDETDALGHVFVDGVCTVCGASEFELMTDEARSIPENTYQLDAPDYCFWDDAAKTLYWGEVDGADQYQISLEYNGSPFGTYTAYQSEYDFSSVILDTNAGSYRATVIAKSYWYADSDAVTSEELIIGYTRLPMPENLTWDMDSYILFWDAVENADRYRVELYGELQSGVATVTTCGVSFAGSVSALGKGELSAFVYAIPASSGSYWESIGAYSRTEIGTRLAEPQNVRWDVENELLCWDAVPNADSYYIEFFGDAFLDETFTDTVSAPTTGYDVSVIAAACGRTPFCAYVTAVGSDSSLYLDSPSGYAGYYPAYTQLPNPANLTWSETGNVLSWDLDSNALYYQITVYLKDNNTAIADFSVYGNSYNFSNLFKRYAKGTTYQVNMMAIADPDSAYLDSYYSFTERTNGIRLAAPQNMVLDDAWENLTWDAVDHANGYLLEFVFEDEHIIGDECSSNSYNCYGLANTMRWYPAGVLSVYITALADTQSVYLDSRRVSFDFLWNKTQLDTPELQWNSTTKMLTWNAVPNAVGYGITVYSPDYYQLLETTVTTNAFDVNTIITQFGNINPIIYVYAIANPSGAYLDSNDAGLELTLTTAVPLSSPDNVDLDENTQMITWDAVENAAGYELVLEKRDYYEERQILKTTLTTNSFDASAVLSQYNSGEFQAGVKALADTTGVYSDSNYAWDMITKGIRLEEVSGFVWHQKTRTLTWKAVPNAAFYSISTDMMDSDLAGIVTTPCLDVSTNYGSHYLSITAVPAEGSQYLESNYQDIWVFNGIALHNPTNLCWDADTQVVSWDAVPNAVCYYVSGDCGSFYTTANEFAPSETPDGEYFSISVSAIGNRFSGYLNSDTVTKTFSVDGYGTLELENIEWDAATQRLYWDAVSGADYYYCQVYKVYNNDTFSIDYYTVSDDFVSLNRPYIDMTRTINEFGCGIYRVEVVASLDGGCSVSAMSDQIAVGERLSCPYNLNWNDATSTVSWNAVENASSYRVTVYQDNDGVTTYYTETNAYVLSDLLTSYGKGAYDITVTAVSGAGSSYLDSCESSPEAIVIGERLATPDDLTWLAPLKTLIWSAVPNAVGYRVAVYKEWVLLDTSVVAATSFDASDLILLFRKGEYRFRITALAPETGHYIESDMAYSNAITIGAYLNTPQNFVWDAETKTLSWDEVPGAEYYLIMVYCDGEYWEGDYTLAASYQFSYAGNGRYVAYVIAIADENSDYFDSDTATTQDIIIGIPLDKPNHPVLDVAAGLLSWDAVPNAEAYCVKLSDQTDVFATEYPTTNSYDISDWLNDYIVYSYSDFTFSVFAMPAAESSYCSSETATCELKYEDLQLKRPKNLHWDTDAKTLYWDAVENAAGYDIEVYFGNERILYTTAAVPSIDISDLCNQYGKGRYYLWVSAVADADSFFVDGDSSYAEDLVVGIALQRPQYLVWNKAQKCLYWDTVPNAAGYEVSIINALTHEIVFTVNVTTDYYDASALLSQYTKGCFEACVVALAATEGDYIDSEECWTNGSYTIGRQLSEPSNIQYNQQTGCLTWTPVPNAYAYEVYVRESDVYSALYSDTVSGCSCELSLENGQYQVQITALAGASADISDSDTAYETLTIGTKLSSPTNFVWNQENQLLSWDAVSGADSYYLSIYKGNSEVEEMVTGTSYDASAFITSNGVGIYYAYISALSSAEDCFESEYIWMSFVIGTRLAAPTNVLWDTAAKTLTWTAVPNAVGYQVSLYRDNDKLLYVRVSQPSFGSTALFDRLGKGKYEAYVVALASGEYVESKNAWSDDFINGTQLPTPQNLVWNTATKVLTWDTVPNAIGYELTIDKNGDVISYFTVTDTQYDASTIIAHCGKGWYEISIAAKAPVSGVYLDSEKEWSDSLPNGIPLATPSNMVWDTSAKTLTWDAVPGAIGYDLYITNNGRVLTYATVTDTRYNVSALVAQYGNGKYKVAVKTLAPVAGNNIDSSYVHSDILAIGTALATPLNLTWDGDTKTLTWDAVTGAVGYAISIANTEQVLIETTVEDCSYDATTFISQYGKGTYNFTVIAKAAAASDYTDSAAAYLTDVSISTKLAAPQNLAWNTATNVLAWDAVENAVGYGLSLFKDGTSIGGATATGCQYDASALVAQYGVGQYQAYVTANAAEVGEYVNSDAAISGMLKITAPLSAPQNLAWSTARVLSWDAVENAVEYEIRWSMDANTDSLTVQTISYDFTECMQTYGKGTYSVSVKALADSEGYYTDSEASETEYAFGYSLTAPQNVVWNAENGLLSWSSVENAAGYLIQLYQNEEGVADEEATVSPFNLTELLAENGVGYYQIGVTALAGESLLYYDSAESTRITIHYTEQLDKPQNLCLHEETSMLTWDAVTNAVGYSVSLYRYDELLNTVQTESTSYSYEGLFASYGNGSYHFTVKALAAAQGDYVDSFADTSDEITFGLALQNPENFIWANTKGLLTWSPVDYAAGYTIRLYINGQLAETRNVGPVLCQLDIASTIKTRGKGIYLASIVAIPYENGKYSESEAVWTEEWEYGLAALAMPVAYWDSNERTLHWSAVKNATGYQLLLLLPDESRIGKQPILVSATTLSYNFSQQLAASNADEFTVYLCAFSEKSKAYSQSDWQILSIDKTELCLNAPQNLTWNKAKTGLSWSAVAGASEYQVTLMRYETGEETELETFSVTETTVNLKDTLTAYGAGQYYVLVTALPDGDSSYVQSEPAVSAVIECGKKLSKPSLKWNSKLLRVEWKAVSGAETYYIWILKDGELLTEEYTDELSVDLTDYLLDEDIGNYEAYIIAYAEPGVKLDSDTASLKFSIKKTLCLPATTSLTCTDKHLKWKAVSKAAGYWIDIYRVVDQYVSHVYGLEVGAKATSCNLSDYMTTPGLYRIHISAIAAENSGAFDGIEAVVEVPVNVVVLKAPKNLHWSEMTAMWNEVPNASGYEVKLVTLSGEEYTKTTTNNSYDFGSILNGLDNKHCTFSVRSLGNGSNGYATGEYSYSSPVYLLPGDEIAAPTNIRWSGSAVCWNAADNAAAYILQVWSNTGAITEEYLLEANVLSFDLAELLPTKAGAIRVKLQACNAGQLRSEAAWSDWYLNKCTVLPAATNLRWEGRTAKWDAVKKTTGYLFKLYELNECGQLSLRDSRSLPSKTVAVDCSDIMTKYGLGNYLFEVIATGTPSKGTTDSTAVRGALLTLTALQEITLTQDEYTLSGSPSKVQKIKLQAACYGGAALTYYSNSSYITISAKGEISVAKNYTGSAEITVTAGAKGDYPQISRTVSVTVNPIENVIKAKDISKTANQTKAQTFSLGVGVQGGAAIHYESSEPWLTIDANGKATLAPAYYGSVQVTIRTDAIGCYLPAESTITVMVKPLSNTIKLLSNQKLKMSATARTYKLNASNSLKLPMTITCNDASITISDGVVTIPAYYIGTAVVTVSTEAYGAYSEASKQVVFTVNP